MRWPWGRGERQELAEAVNPVPVVEPAADAYSALGLWQPVGVGLACVAAFAVADLVGAVAVGDLRWKALVLAGAAVVAAVFAGFTRGRDRLHDRMRLAKPVPNGTEVDDDGGKPLVLRLAPVGLWGAVVFAGTEVAHLLHGNEAHWFLLLAAGGLGASIGGAASARAVRAHERERGVRLFRIADREQYEDTTGEDLSDSDPGPMFTGR